MSERLKKTRIVKFKEDYKAGGRIIYKKDSEHPIHEKTVETLQKQGVKMDVKTVDIEKLTEKAKAAFDKAQDKEGK